MTLPAVFERYQSFVFDCDGVLLDSNRVKTEAFRTAALPYGLENADALMEYHVANGGVSRFKKMEYFFEGLLERAPEDGEIDDILDRFASATRQGLVECAVTPGLSNVLAALPQDRVRMVVSGGMQSELREIFEERKLAQHFTAIFGSPDTKEDIFSRETEAGNLQHPAIYIGDSKYDFVASNAFGMDFAFLYGWTEFSEWEEFFSGRDVMISENISTLFNVA